MDTIFSFRPFTLGVQVTLQLLATLSNAVAIWSYIKIVLFCNDDTSTAAKSTLNFNTCIYTTVKMPDINSLTFTVSRGRRNNTTFTVLAQFPYELNSQPIVSGFCHTNLSSSVLFFNFSLDFDCFYYKFLWFQREIREATVLLLLHNTNIY